jgi:5-oxoprolinase (ATP-hydrolysing)
MNGRYRIGFDIGGTFTDFVLYDTVTGDTRLNKCLTTYHDPSQAALHGLRELVGMMEISLADVDEIVHGTTLVGNALIERRGARVGLITTSGFRDILEMGTEQRYDIYDLFLRFPEPLVPRNLRLEVQERIDRDGSIVIPLDIAAVRASLRSLAEAAVESVAICLLNSYRNAAHEARVAEIAAQEFPELAVSISSEVAAQIREYQRCVTTCANAYVQPLMQSYLGRLERELSAAGFGGSLRLMHSAGGILSPETARAFPIRLVESGPAGGGLVSAFFGTAAGSPDVISFDMGGTTAKACLIEASRIESAPTIEVARVSRFTKGSGLPINVPAIDMIEIGAGGGSIARIDQTGLLKVGPDSAGSDPGPACYGKGGIRPTVTDANVLLGYYAPDFFLGGRMQLDYRAAERAIDMVAEPLGITVNEAAWGIRKVVVENMASAAKVHLVEKGKDPRNYAIVGIGGAGPAHVAEVARILGASHAIIPQATGAASALGFLSAPLSFEVTHSYPIEFCPGFSANVVNRLLGEMEIEARAHLADAGVAMDKVTVERVADMRLVGQTHDIAVLLPDGSVGEDSLSSIHTVFTRAYTSRYSCPPEGARIEAISFRVRCVAPVPDLSVTKFAKGLPSAAKRKGVRRAYFESGFRDVPVYDRYALSPGDNIAGPAIIEERESTTVISPLDSIVVDGKLNLCVTIGSSQPITSAITADTPLTEAIKMIEDDPITLEIMWSRLVNVVEEMWLTVCRTAFSLVISEAQDFACDLLDPEGETLAHSPRAMPVFNLTLPRAVKGVLARYPAETLKPGDVLVTNDPWLCAGHLFDIAVITPVFADGLLVGLMATVGNVADIGGTKDQNHTREIYEEGIQIPPMKLFDEGRRNETLVRLLAENVRASDQVLGDIDSFVAANALGAERLLAFMLAYGMRDLRALAAVVQRRSESVMRAAVSVIPDGEYFAESSNNPQGEKLRYPLELTVKGEQIHLDFSGAPPLSSQGGLNCPLNYTTAHATYPIKCMLTPQIRGNAGCHRPFTVFAPEDSILNARHPSAVGLRQRTGWYLAPSVFGALAEALPERVQANTGLPFTSNIYGHDADGRAYSDILFVGGGQGASAASDGKSALLWPTSASNTSIELFEARVPILVLEKAYIPDSGGAGRHRGGLGQRVRLRKLFNDGLSTFATVYPEGVDNPVQGLFGGKPGMTAHGRVVDSRDNILRDCGCGALVELTSDEEILEIIVAGGAGYGDPFERSSELVDRDIRLGLVSTDAAAREYGCDLKETGNSQVQSGRSATATFA